MTETRFTPSGKFIHHCRNTSIILLDIEGYRIQLLCNGFVYSIDAMIYRVCATTLSFEDYFSLFHGSAIDSTENKKCRTTLWRH